MSVKEREAGKVVLSSEEEGQIFDDEEDEGKLEVEK